MDSNLATAAIMLVVGFMGGIMAAIVLIVAVASRRVHQRRDGPGTGPGELPEANTEVGAPPHWQGGFTE
jgi:hypothetical protein